METRKTKGSWSLTTVLLAGAVLLAACVAPSPTPTLPQPPVGAPTPTKAPTATPTKRPLVKLNLGTSTEATVFLPIWNTLARDIFREEGLDIDRYAISGSGKVTTAVAAGDLQFASTSYPEPLLAANEGLPVLAVGALNRGMGSQTVLRKEVVQRLAIPEKASVSEKLQALKGLTISATSKGGYTDNIFRALLKKAGIDADRDLTITYVAKDADALAAFERGATDAMTIAPPSSTTALEKGIGVMLINWRKGEVPEVYDSLYMALTTNRQWAKDNRDLLEAALRSVWKGFDLLWREKEESRKAIRSYKHFQDMTENSFNEAFGLEFDILLPQPLVPMEMFQKSIDLFNSYSPPEQQVNLKAPQFYDPSYAETAKKQLGL